MKAKIKFKDEIMDVTIEMVDGVMVVTPKESDKEEVDYSHFNAGDIIASECQEGYDYYECVYILKEPVKKPSDFYIESHCALITYGRPGQLLLNTPSSPYSNTIFRYATEDEKQKLFDALAKEGKMWDAEKKAVVDLKWEPKSNEYYVYVAFAVSMGFLIGLDYWDYSEDHVQRQEKGWAFPNTKEGKAKCQALCDKLNEAIKDVNP